MKPYLLPAATALVGFSIAWIAKPVTTAPATIVQSNNTTAPERTSPRPDIRESASTTERPTEVKASDFPLAEQAEAGPKSTEEAKLLRLSEALALSVDQQGTIVQLVRDVQATVDVNLSALEDISKRGKAIEEGLQKILTPEQFAKFQEIQIRERDNRTELRAQRMLADTIEFIDLSPEQREDVIDRLRQKSKSDLQSIPAAATLLFDKSILPNGGKELSPDGLLLLAQMGEEISTGSPEEVHAKVMNRHKQELEEILKCYDGILTPGQMGQYYAALAEKKVTMERMRELTSRISASPEPTPVVTPEAAPPKPSAGLVEIISDDDSRDDYNDE
ncbi:MAG: hypothetical protein V4640_02405 [Verrucomicrobiota bacterium]